MFSTFTLKITTGGTLNAMAWQLSFDSGTSYLAPTYSAGGSGGTSYDWIVPNFAGEAVKVTFPSGTYTLNDTFTYDLGTGNWSHTGTGLPAITATNLAPALRAAGLR